MAIHNLDQVTHLTPLLTFTNLSRLFFKEFILFAQFFFILLQVLSVYIVYNNLLTAIVVDEGIALYYRSPSVSLAPYPWVAYIGGLSL